MKKIVMGRGGGVVVGVLGPFGWELIFIPQKERDHLGPRRLPGRCRGPRVMTCRRHGGWGGGREEVDGFRGTAGKAEFWAPFCDFPPNSMERRSRHSAATHTALGRDVGVIPVSKCAQWRRSARFFEKDTKSFPCEGNSLGMICGADGDIIEGAQKTKEEGDSPVTSQGGHRHILLTLCKRKAAKSAPKWS